MLRSAGPARRAGTLTALTALTSQVASSATSFLVLITLARTQPAIEFGWTALTIAFVMALVGLCRSIFGTPVALSAGNKERLRQEASFAATLPTILALVVTLPLSVSLLVSERTLLATVAIATPVILFQDSLRQSCIAMGRVKLAAAVDSLRVGILLLALQTTIFADPPTSTPVIAWAGGAAVAAFIQVRLTHWRRFEASLAGHLRDTWRTRVPLLGDSVIVQSTPLATSIIVGGAFGAIGLSGFRGAGTLLGPISILLTTIPLVALPALSRANTTSFTDVVRTTLPIAGFISASCVGFAAIAWVAPDSLGQKVLGDSWGPTSHILPILALQYAAQPWTIMATIAFKLSGKFKLLVGLRAANSATILLIVFWASRFTTLYGTVIGILCVEFAAAALHLAMASRSGSIRSRKRAI